MKMTSHLLVLGVVAAALFSPITTMPGLAANAIPANAVARLPVKEVTVFKDGHAFVLHEGKVPTDASGNVVMDYLPAPVIGTFWAYSADKGAKLSGVVAGQRRTVIERTALTLRELIEGNVGAEASITETNGATYPGTLLGFPTRTPEELAATSPPNSGERLSEKSNLVLLRTAEGTKVVPLEKIQDLLFKQPPKPKSGTEEFRNSLTLRFDWKGGEPAKSAEVGLVYLQKGIRWIPSYKIDLDGKGKAAVRLQATVLNELTDLEGTMLQLVIGVPSFYFKDTIDPMALQQTAAQLSQYFQTDAGHALDNRRSALAYNFSNAMMTQVARAGDYRGGGEPAEGGQDNSLPEGSKNEDLFVFTVPKITLKKGERAVLPLAEFTVPYEDVFALDLPFAPPTDIRQHFNTQQQSELAKLFNAPKVTHKARLQNKSQYPFTTAPALLLREGRVLAQGMMTYAAQGASADVNITAALDIAVKKTDNETKRTPNAYSQDGSSYMRVDLGGKVRLTNHRKQPVEVEVIRHALGIIDSADHDGKVEMNNVFEGTDFAPNVGSESYPDWWSWYNWPWWWHRVNGVGRVTWKITLEPGKPVELGYAWHYYWR
jgi:hypothetical protein